MRKSQPLFRSRSRLLRAGFTASAVGAAVLVAPQAAYAAAMTMPYIIPAGQSTNLTVSDPQGAYNTSTGSVQLSSAACNAKFQTAAPNGPWNTTVVGNRTATAITVTVPGTGGPPAGSNGATKPYYACVYDGVTAGVSDLRGSAVFYVGTAAMSSANGGVTGGGNQITVTAGPNTPIFTNINSVAAVFTNGNCGATYGTNNPPNLTVTNVNRQSNTMVSFHVPPGVVSNGAAPSFYNICLYDASSSNGPLLSVQPYHVSVAGVVPASGNYLSSTGVTVNSPSPFLSGAIVPGVLLVGSHAGCPGTYSTTPISTPSGPVTPQAITTAGHVRRLSNYRAAVTVPPLTLSSPGSPTPYQVCFYNSSANGASLAGTATYTAAVVANPTAVMPSAGPAAGGSTITVVGSDFPFPEQGRITATLGGAPLTDIVTLSDKAFTATTPPHAVEQNVALVVSTSAGTKALPGAYSYLNPVEVGPNTAPNTTPTVDVSVRGMNFMSIGFGSSGNAGRVFLVDGVYDGAEAGSHQRANGPVAECVNVLPIGDEELICTLQLNRRLSTVGTAQGIPFFNPVTYTNTLTTDVTTAAGSRIITSAAGKFHPNDVGQPIVQSGNANIPQGSIVTSVLSPAKAVISQPSPAAPAGAFTATIGNSTPVRTLTYALSTISGSSAVTLTNGAFTSADIGRVFHGTTGVPDGATIVSVAPGGAGATLSEAATATTAGSMAAVTVANNSATISSANILATDVGAVIGANTVGIPVGTTITAVGTPGTSGTMSVVASGGGTAASLPVNRVVTANLYAAAPVPPGSYHITVVSNGAPDAANTDPNYFQTDVTSSSVFTVAPF